MELRWISLLAVSLLVAVPLVPAKSASVRVPYEGSAPVTYQGLQECSQVLPLGVVCLDFEASDHGVVFKIEDATTLAVGGTWYLHDAQGTLVDLGQYCGGGGVSLPGGSGTLVVRVDTLNGPIGCFGEGRTSFGPATKGIVDLVVH